MAHAAVLAGIDRRQALPIAATAAVFLFLFGAVLLELGGDWWSNSEYGHGFLFLPISAWLIWKNRIDARAPEPVWGLVVLGGSVLLLLAALAAGEFFTRRVAAVGALGGLALFHFGWRQVRAWWLAFALILFTIPLPEVILNTITLPLQLMASRLAVWMLEARFVPVALSGNIILLPGQQLFVAEACSGLRSLSALLGLTLLIAGTALHSPWARAALLLVAIPAALVANALRVFATGFGAYYIGPEVAEGAMHTTAGFAVFALGLAVVGLVAWGLSRLESDG